MLQNTNTIASHLSVSKLQISEQLITHIN